jgi:hypothetical protein
MRHDVKHRHGDNGRERSIDSMGSGAGIRIVHPIGELLFADWKKLLAIDGGYTSRRIRRRPRDV